jgi:predicted DNA-binding transcriptional regulator YafY
MVYSPATRLLAALEMLQARASITAAELARRLAVEPRSVRRYVMMLQDLGIPVEATRGRYGGYRLRPGFKLPPLMLTDDEALAVTLGLLAAQGLGLGGAAPAVDGALAKIERVLPLMLRERVRALRETVALDVAPRDGVRAPRGDWVPLFSAAAHNGQRMRMRYGRREGEESERTLDPYGLVYRAGRWYVVGHCHLRRAVRVFRLDRVLAAAPTEERFKPPADFDPLAYAVASFAAIPARWLVEVLLETTLERVYFAVPPDFATLEETPEGVVLRAYDDDLEHTARFLAGLGCPVHVRQPPELRAALRLLGEALVGMAETM